MTIFQVLFCLISLRSIIALRIHPWLTNPEAITHSEDALYNIVEDYAIGQPSWQSVRFSGGTSATITIRLTCTDPLPPSILNDWKLDSSSNRPWDMYICSNGEHFSTSLPPWYALYLSL